MKKLNKSNNLSNLYINNLYLEGNKGTIQTFRLIPDYDRLGRFISSEMDKIFCGYRVKGKEEVDFERLSVRLKEAFERLLPERSQFEV